MQGPEPVLETSVTALDTLHGCWHLYACFTRMWPWIICLLPWGTLRRAALGSGWLCHYWIAGSYVLRLPPSRSRGLLRLCHIALSCNFHFSWGPASQLCRMDKWEKGVSRVGSQWGIRGCVGWQLLLWKFLVLLTMLLHLSSSLFITGCYICVPVCLHLCPHFPFF